MRIGAHIAVGDGMYKDSVGPLLLSTRREEINALFPTLDYGCSEHRQGYIPKVGLQTQTSKSRLLTQREEQYLRRSNSHEIVDQT